MNGSKKPSIIRKKLSDELTVLLHKGDLPSDSSDEEYVPSDGYNVSLCWKRNWLVRLLSHNAAEKFQN